MREGLLDYDSSGLKISFEYEQQLGHSGSVFRCVCSLVRDSSLVCIDAHTQGIWMSTDEKSGRTCVFGRYGARGLVCFVINK